MREMYHELYEVKKQRKLPIKWMSPEAIYEQIFTSKSDVYVLFLTSNTAEPITRLYMYKKLRPYIIICPKKFKFVHNVFEVTKLCRTRADI